MADLVTCAMLATLTDPTEVTLPTNTITRGQIRHQIATLNLTTHTRSLLGRTYAQLLLDPDITQLNNNLTPLQYNQTKGRIGRPSDKIALATAMLYHMDVLQAYEDGLQKQEMKDPPPSKTDHQNQGKTPTAPRNLTKTTPDNQNKEKEKMPPLTMLALDPLKQMRQKHATDAKLLAAQKRQRAGALKEQERIRAAEAAEKQANTDRLRSPIPP